MAVSTLQVANPANATVTRQAQTTANPPQSSGTPWSRMSRQGQIQGPSNTGQAFGTIWTPTLRAVGGYMRTLEFYVTATGGNYSAATYGADAPYSVIQNIFLRDPYGQPIYQVSGYSLYLQNLYGGQVGVFGFGNNPASLPSWVAGSATTGAFTFRLQIPLESDSSGYCSLPFQNASSQPQIQVTFNTAAVVYATHTGTIDPTLTLALDETFWMQPVNNPQAAPADAGSSVQWSELKAQQSPGNATYSRLQLARVGTYITTIILTLRDSTGARIDAWPLSDLALWVDGVPVLMESLNERFDKMFTQFGVTPRPTGVIVYTFKNSIQSFVSTGDSYDVLLPTTPATLLEVAGTFQTITNNPAQITVTLGELYPNGGVPYTHLGS